MATIPLPHDGGSVRVDDRITLHTRGLRGTVETQPAAAGARELATSSLDAALEESGLRLGNSFDLHPELAPESGERELTTAPSAEEPAVQVSVDVNDDESCVLLVEDTTTGAVRWIIPDNAEEARATAVGARALGGTSLRFTVPLGGTARVAGARGFPGIGALEKKVKTFFFKVTDDLLGPIIHGFAKKWEATHRPAFTRMYGPDNYQVDTPDFARLTNDDWRSLSQGRALLFVHGTFSTSGAFAPLQPQVMAELSRRYEGRTFAFNHPTMTADPRDNALAFLSEIPSGTKLDVDIVCHSRGGLVAREIAALGALNGSVTVRQIVFVAATNAGTALASDDHMVDMIDRFTTVAKFIPEGTAKRVVDAVVLVVKVLAHALLHDLEGLRAMNPDGPFVQGIDVAGGPDVEYYAMASNYEPKAGTPFFSISRGEDLVVDKVFDDVANDLVVPRDGVFAKNGATGFPIASGRVMTFEPAEAVIHTEFFGQERTNAKLLEWLAPTAAATRAIASGRSVDDVARVLDAMRDQVIAALTTQAGTRGLSDKQPPLTPAELESLRPHVVNLSEGTFKRSGKFSTSPEDVDAIIYEHIPQWVATQPAAGPLRIAVWAHGGLIGEQDGLRIALKHVAWWKKNGIYPLYFVWETGLFDALRSILEAVARKIPGLGTRDIFDFTTDPLVQEGVRALGGVQVWGAMKHNAELGVAADGGARYVAKKLAELNQNATLRGGRAVEFHAVGHSAGSIFHSYFLPAATAEQVPTFKTLQLLAPAITIPEFTARLADRIGEGRDAERAIMYTMAKHYEEDDNCIGIYKKSLLYLIHHALERERRTPILGLEIALRADPKNASLFGLNGASNAAGRVVWSVTDGGDPRFSSRSTSHGGFDDDPTTMNSVAANVLDETRARVPYTGSPAGDARAIIDWPQSDEWLEGVDRSSAGSFFQMMSPAKATGGAAGPAAPAGAPLASPAPSPTKQPPRRPPASSGGARRLLSVGIDAYPSPNTLTGCVADTKAWSKALAKLGFEVLDPLLDGAATHRAIVEALRSLVRGSKPGDVLAFHYSGHGTQVRDTDGDEDDGTDEALVPVDFSDGAFLIDDDLRAIFQQLPEGVNLTCFIDCCHSATITRMLGRNADVADPSEHMRFLKPTAEWNDWMRAHERFRSAERASRDITDGSRGFDRNALRWVNYSACDATEVALEHSGNGDFTRNATGLLAGDISKYTHRSFQDAVIGVFGTRRKQTPQLDCPDGAQDHGFLQSLR